jgi:hypothetical protein
MDRSGVALEGKNVNIYFLDNSDNQISRKSGLCLKDLPTKIIIENTRGYVEVIPYYRIIRVVEREG